MPVRVGGLKVESNDLIHADANGVLHIPHSIAPAVAELCEPFMQAEQIVLDYLHSSKPTPEGYGEAFQRMKAAIAALRARAHEFLHKDRRST